MKNALTVALGVGVVIGLDHMWVLLAVVVTLIALPPSWDPAIRFKEWANGQKK